MTLCHGTPSFAFHGIVAQRDDEHVTVRLFPGFELDVRTADIEQLEETQDELTGRAYVFVRLKSDADIHANFRPRLARMALACSEGVPFAYLPAAACDGAHGLASGAAPSLPPLLDPAAVVALSRALPADTWGSLTRAAGAAQAASTKPTSYSTDTMTNKVTTNETTHYDTVTEIDGRIVHTPDRALDPLNDYVVDGSTGDSKQDESW